MEPFDKTNPPQFWQFKGHVAPGTYFELQVVGRPSAKALRNLIKQVQLTVDWLEEDVDWLEMDEAAKASPPAKADLSGAQRNELTRLAQDEPISTPPPPTDGEVK